MTIRARLSLSLVLLSLAACSQAPDALFRHEAAAFGMPLSITIHGQSEAVAREAAAAAVADIRFFEEVTHPWQPGSMGRTNLLLSTTGEFSANPSLLPLIEQARSGYERTGGLYNPALGKALALWGFHGESLPATTPPPDAEALAEVMATAPSMRQIHIEGIRMRSENSAVQIDLGAMARGHAIDMAAAALRDHGITRAEIRLGQDRKLLGAPNDTWQLPFGRLRLESDEALVVVAAEEGGYPLDGQWAAPILHRDTGRPVTGVTAVAVVADTAAEAAILAHALYAAGPERWERTVAELGPLDAVLLPASSPPRVTPSMMQRGEFHSPASGNETGAPATSRSPQ